VKDAQALAMDENHGRIKSKSVTRGIVFEGY